MSEQRLERFTVAHRLWHLGLIAVFMVLSITGIAWMYLETSWGKWLASWFGGWEGTLQVHGIVGIVLLIGFAWHILWSIGRVDWTRPWDWLMGPESLVMQLRDIKGLFRHLGWVIGVCEAPRNDRWTWWMKFDYWAVWWGFVITGVTGLMLYSPVLTSELMPGWLLNVALWVHRIEAVLAMAHIFTIHFFVEHFRPSHFPYNAAMFDGQVSLEEAREEYPEWMTRMETEGCLDAQVRPEPPVPLRILYFSFGYAIIILSLFLLVFGLLNVAALSL